MTRIFRDDAPVIAIIEMVNRGNVRGRGRTPAVAGTETRLRVPSRETGIRQGMFPHHITMGVTGPV